MMEKIQPLSLTSVKDISHYLSSLMNTVYKSDGSFALIMNDTGEMYMTKNTLKIFSQMQCKHPVAKLIIQAVDNHYKQTGDGGKTFIFILEAVLQCIDIQESRSNSINHVINIINYLQTLYNQIKLLSFTNKFVLRKCENPEFYFKHIIRTFCQTKFSHFLADRFCTLLCEFVNRSIRDHQKIEEALNQLIIFFPLLVTKISSSIEHSQVVEGFVFSKVIDANYIINMEKVNFIVLENIPTNNSFQGSLLNIEEDCEVNQFLDFYLKMFAVFTKTLKENNVHFIFTSEFVPEEFKYLCRKNNILLMEKIDKEELDFFLFYLNAVALSFWDTDQLHGNIHQATFVKTITLGLETLLHISVIYQTSVIAAHHIIISSPLKSLSNDYFDSFYYCLKLLLVSVKKIPCTSLCNESKSLDVLSVSCPFIDWMEQLIISLESMSNSISFSRKVAFELKNFVRNKFYNSSSNVLYFEPIERHEMLFSNVLYFVIQLLKIDSLIYVQKN